MKKLTALFVVLFAVAFTSNIFAQNTATATSDASASLITAIDITKTSDLMFGKIAKNANTAGSVTIAPVDELDISYSPTSMETTLSDRSAAKFTVTGADGQLFKINLPVTIELNGPNSGKMTITTEMNLENNQNVLTGGSVPLYVGGTLEIGAAQTLGEYNGSFSVTVQYE